MFPFLSGRNGALFVSKPVYITFALCEGIQNPLNSLFEGGFSKGFVFSFSMFCSYDVVHVVFLGGKL